MKTITIVYISLVFLFVLILSLSVSISINKIIGEEDTINPLQKITQAGIEREQERVTEDLERTRRVWNIE